MDKLQVQAQAIQLRKEGYLYNQIADAIHIARSTAYLWVKDTLLTDSESATLAQARKDARRRSLMNMNAVKAERFLAKTKQLESEAYTIVKCTKMETDYQRILCAVMFWCEGEKDVSSGVRFINSDPNMMRSFLKLLRAGFDIDESKFRALPHLHEYHDKGEQIKFWSDVTGIPAKQFYKTFVKPHTGKNIHIGYPGCLSLRYSDANLAKLLKMIYSNLGKSLGA